MKIKKNTLAKVMIWLLCGAMMIGLTPTLTMTASAAGTPDTSWYTSNPSATEFTINTADELAGLAELVNAGTSSFYGKTINLGASIDLSVYGESYNNNKGWIPIGRNSSYRFRGTFNGNGKIISNLYINDTALNYAGLFGNVYNGIRICNVGMENVNITAKNYVGGVAGYIYVSSTSDTVYLENCYVTGMLSAVDTNGYAGGIVAYIEGYYSWNTYVRSNASLLLSITADKAGRIVGYGKNTNILNNVAFDGTTDKNGGKFTTGEFNGSILSNQSICNEGTLGGHFTSENGWIIQDGMLPGTIEIPEYIISIAPTVTSIDLSPSSVIIQQGASQQFSAVVNGTNNPEQTVTWNVSGNNSSGTKISSGGVLTVASDESAVTLTVRATSTVRKSVSGTTIVSLPTVSSISVSPSASVVKQGATQKFTATVSGTNNPAQTVTWSIYGNNYNRF